jgi:hypothetical protein
VLPVNPDFTPIADVKQMGVNEPFPAALFVFNQDRFALFDEHYVKRLQAGFFTDFREGLSVRVGFKKARDARPLALVGAHLLTAQEDENLPVRFKNRGNDGGRCRVTVRNLAPKKEHRLSMDSRALLS